MSFIDPAGANASRRGSLLAGGRAADLREASKRKEYEAAMGTVWTESSFVPFVLETTGRLGRAAAKLIHHLVVDRSSHRHFSATDLANRALASTKRSWLCVCPPARSAFGKPSRVGNHLCRKPARTSGSLKNHWTLRTEATTPRTRSQRSYHWHPCILFTTKLRWTD